jgi:2,3-bisphosphoglycerate-independent phosphoglycerate mutase
MKHLGYGEDQPRSVDDRLPSVLVILDGLGDRGLLEHDGLTPSEAAVTPTLDRLTRRGATGWHVPFGWGPAAASERAHWAMFGFGDVPFPGRAVLEGLGADIEIPLDVATTFACVRTSEVVGNELRIFGRTARTEEDEADARTLFTELQPLLRSFGAQLRPMGRGEALLTFPDFSHGEVTDSDPFFETFHPWLKVRATSSDTEAIADHLNGFLTAAREKFIASDVNKAREALDKPALNVLTTKWSGTRRRIPTFEQRCGVAGAAVTDSRMYRGLARILDMQAEHQAPMKDHAQDMLKRVEIARRLIARGARFVHVHTKATDEAGHARRPHEKRKVIEALDDGLKGLDALADRAIVAVTGDHATPSSGGVLHTADATPFLLVGPTVRADEVAHLGERECRSGWYGRISASEVLPLMFSHANRPVFLGHRSSPLVTHALPDKPLPMSI